MQYRLKEEFLDAQHEIQKDKLYASLGVAQVATASDILQLLNRQKEEMEQIDRSWGKKVSDMARRSVCQS